MAIGLESELRYQFQRFGDEISELKQEIRTLKANTATGQASYENAVNITNYSHMHRRSAILDLDDDGDIDHGGLAGIADDDHTQYALLLGRSGGQTLIGGIDSGDDLIFESTSHATKGFILFNDESRIGINTSSPVCQLNLVGDISTVNWADGFNRNTVTYFRTDFIQADLGASLSGLFGVENVWDGGNSARNVNATFYNFTMTGNYVYAGAVQRSMVGQITIDSSGVGFTSATVGLQGKILFGPNLDTTVWAINGLGQTAVEAFIQVHTNAQGSVYDAVSFRSRPWLSQISCTNLIHYSIWDNDGNSVITNQYGLQIQDISDATNNYGIYSLMTAGANKYFINETGGVQSLFTGTINFQGNTTHDDSVIAYFGTDQDVELRHDGGNFLLDLITGSWFVDLNANLTIRDRDDSNASMFDLNTNARLLTIGAAADNIATTHYGNMTFPDGDYIYIGTGNDFGIAHDGSNTIATNITGYLSIVNTVSYIHLQSNTTFWIDLKETFNIRDDVDSQETLLQLDTQARTMTIGASDGNDDIALALYGTFALEGSPVIDAILDEDLMGSDSDTALATQQSIKAYVDTEVSGAGDDLGDHQADQALDMQTYNILMSGTTTTDQRVRLSYLTQIPASVDNGSIWTESDGLHIYVSGAEQILTSAAGDDLGNHTATEDLKMATWGITNVNTITINNQGAGANPQLLSNNATYQVLELTGIFAIGSPTFNSDFEFFIENAGNGQAQFEGSSTTGWGGIRVENDGLTGGNFGAGGSLNATTYLRNDLFIAASNELHILGGGSQIVTFNSTSIALQAGITISGGTFNISSGTWTGSDIDIEYLDEDLHDLLSYGSDNASWMNCPFEGASNVANDLVDTTGDIFGSGSSTSYIFSIPLAPYLGNSNRRLYIEDLEVHLADADGSNYITLSRIMEKNGLNNNTILNDGNNLTTTGVHTVAVDSYADGYGANTILKVILASTEIASSDLEIAGVQVKYYYV